MPDIKVDRAKSWRATATALENQYAAENVLIYNGHAFRISMELISYTASLIAVDQVEITLFDSNNIPCYVESLQDFYDKLIKKHIEANRTLTMAWAARKNDL